MPGQHRKTDVRIPGWVDKEEWQTFLEACKREGKNAQQAMREFIREKGGGAKKGRENE